MDEIKALEELQFIRKVIDETKQNALYSGRDYIFWGILIIVGMMTSYILALNNIHHYYFWIWVVLIPVGWIFSIMSRRKHRAKNPLTYAGRVISALWTAAGIAISIVGFIGTPIGNINPMAISPIACIVVGVAYFATGAVVKSKWFSNLAFGWWAGAIIMMFVVSEQQFLVMALLMLFFQTIPGIITYRKYKKETAVIS
jgi:Ca2+/Na+ antiporter